MEESLIPWELEEPAQYEPLWFEKINLYEIRVWVHHRRWSTSIYITLAYLLFLWTAKQWMHFRPPLKLRKSLLLWNGFLATLSMTAVVRGGPELYNVLSGPNGFHRSLCVRDGLNQPAAFWGFMFLFSKFLHFGDTVFLVLRKKPITFLHWIPAYTINIKFGFLCPESSEEYTFAKKDYHHSLVFWATFYSFADAEPISRFAAFMNFSVHFMMYSYYFLEGLNFRIPKIIKMLITGSEVFMFVIGLYINVYTVRILLRGEECARSWNSIALQCSAGTSFLLLFTFFFYKNYLVTSQKSKKL